MALATNLVASGNPLEVQHFGYQLLQSLVRTHRLPVPCVHPMHVPSQGLLEASVLHGQVTSRWERFTAEEHAQLAGLAFSLFQQGAERCASCMSLMCPECR